MISCDFHILQVARLQQMAKKQLNTLGVYRTKGYQNYPKRHISNRSKEERCVEAGGRGRENRSHPESLSPKSPCEIVLCSFGPRGWRATQVQVIDGTSLQCSALRPWTGPLFCVIASDKRHIESLTHDKQKLHAFAVEDLVAVPGQA